MSLLDYTVFSILHADISKVTGQYLNCEAQPAERMLNDEGVSYL